MIEKSLGYVCSFCASSLLPFSVFRRDRSDTAVVGPPRPVCKTKPKNNTLSFLTPLSLSRPLLSGFSHLSQEHPVNNDKVVSSVHCVLATFVLSSRPLCVI